ncbi:MAG: ATPase, T2SS/T4P/T4SS family [Rhodoferax sp.]|nr:ATPase, T2SS/T4P/T4SS family [Rhodoferax sp.]
MKMPVRKTYSMRCQDAMMDALSPIRSLLDDVTINEIMINGPNDVFVRQRGPDRRVDVELSSRSIATAITLLASFVEKEVNADQLVLSARLPGFRIECALPPVSVKGPSMTIRRHASRILTLEEYVETGTIDPQQAIAIQDLMHSRKNLLIAGGTYSGKTTLMNCILALIDPNQRLFVIEQVSELKISAPNCVLMECDPDFGVTPTMAVKTAMRYSPDRIILGELRGPEANDWLEASNTGHPGSAATIHANNASDALKRLGSLVLMASTGMPHEVIQDRIASTVDAVLFIEQRYGVRQLSEICLVEDYDRARGKFVTKVINHLERKK